MTYSRSEIADRAGVSPEFVDRLVDIGFIKTDDDGRLKAADGRRAQMALSLEQEAGIELGSLTNAIARGQISLDFMDAPVFDRWAAQGPETFAEVSRRTGLPEQLLFVIREAIGSATPTESDRMREDELAIIPLLEVAKAIGFRPPAVEQMLRVFGESLRRIAETEAEAWRSEVQNPQLAAGMSMQEMGAFSEGELTERFGLEVDATLRTILHAHEAQTWTANIIDGFEQALIRAGLHSRLERPPAMCFVDIAGYTRLTEERGDRAAAELVGVLTRLVQSTSLQFGGRPVKWLGDGVMLHFREPGRGVEAALTIVDGVKDAGLPPAHVGLHAGPVILQDGDYFGQTVNLASRIADYARPGEVLVSDEVVLASVGAALSFVDIGPVELKGVAGPLRLFVAHRAA